MIGIKGTGMSALAVNLKAIGVKITGSDFPESFFTDTLLKKHRIRVLTPFSAHNIPRGADLVIASTAYNNKNVELQEAKQRGFPVLTYPEVLGLISRQLQSIAVCGSHGKTTTSGALAFLLSKTQYHPIANIGSIVPQLLRYRPHRPKLFVFEADEYQNKFQYFYPRIVILTNIDYDHPDYFRSPRHYKSVFRRFIKRIPSRGLLIYCADDKNARDVARRAKCKKLGYGFSAHARFKIKISEILPQKMKFEVAGLGAFKSKLIGNHNALNLAATALCADYLKMPPEKIKKIIADFNGTKRRLELVKKTRINGQRCVLIDDYGHHPTEVKSTIAALKKAYPDNVLWTIFQPHTFSRTQALFNDFVSAFDNSDETIILDIYASKRETTGEVHSKDLVKAIGSKNVFYRPDIAQAADFLKRKIKTESIVLTIGASNVWELANLL